MTLRPHRSKSKNLHTLSKSTASDSRARWSPLDRSQRRKVKFQLGAQDSDSGEE